MKSPITEEQEKIARFAKALSHPIRVYIIQYLIDQACCYSGDLTEILPIAKSTLSQHLKELKAAGIIQGEIELPKVRYCIEPENWELCKSLFYKLMKS
jgi:ArsR family transcriptional regulator, arsenate/arsenite/antimonite-responsive transcriptional repressor